MVRYLNDVFLRSGDDALSVNWFEITVVNVKTGEQLYHNSCITNHRLTADNVGHVAHVSRGRWKIENENNNVLDITPFGRTFQPQPHHQGPARWAMEAYVPRLVTSPSS